MGSNRAIWKHEVGEANQIARALIQDQAVKINWGVVLLPLFLLEIIRYRHRRRVIRKNLLYTRQLALEAARNIIDGQERGWQIRRIEIKTRESLDRDKSGQYTEKIRRKQLGEIELLITHYIALINSGKLRYPEMLKAVYPSKGNYVHFLNELRKWEAEVIQAAVTTTRKGTKKQRRKWFEKVQTITREARTSEADRIYGGR
jgi:hypothetical protein